MGVSGRLEVEADGRLALFGVHPSGICDPNWMIVPWGCFFMADLSGTLELDGLVAVSDTGPLGLCGNVGWVAGSILCRFMTGVGTGGKSELNDSIAVSSRDISIPCTNADTRAGASLPLPGFLLTSLRAILLDFAGHRGGNAGSEMSRFKSISCEGKFM